MSAWALWAVLAAVFAALVTILGKIGVHDVDSTAATTIRALVMAGILLVVALGLGKVSTVREVGLRPLLFITLSGAAGAASWLCFFLALRQGSAVGVAALDRLSVVFALVLAAAFLGEAITWRSATGAALVLAGTVLLVRPG
jgi:transporter family protein